MIQELYSLEIVKWLIDWIIILSNHLVENSNCYILLNRMMWISPCLLPKKGTHNIVCWCRWLLWNVKSVSFSSQLSSSSLTPTDVASQPLILPLLWQLLTTQKYTSWSSAYFLHLQSCPVTYSTYPWCCCIYFIPLWCYIDSMRQSYIGWDVSSRESYRW